jgi:hypothetical protein
MRPHKNGETRAGQSVRVSKTVTVGRQTLKEP